MSAEKTLEELRAAADAAIEEATRQAHERAAEERLKSTKHVAASVAAGVDPKLDPTDASTAKSYVRARAYATLYESFNILEGALRDPKVTTSTKIAISLKLIERAVGNPTVPSGIKADTSQLAPVDIINLVLAEQAVGNVTKEFADTMLDLLRSKLQGTKLRDMVDNAVEQRLKAPKAT